MITMSNWQTIRFDSYYRARPHNLRLNPDFNPWTGRKKSFLLDSKIQLALEDFIKNKLPREIGWLQNHADKTFNFSSLKTTAANLISSLPISKLRLKIKPLPEDELNYLLAEALPKTLMSLVYDNLKFLSSRKTSFFFKEKNRFSWDEFFLILEKVASQFKFPTKEQLSTVFNRLAQKRFEFRAELIDHVETYISPGFSYFKIIPQQTFFPNPILKTAFCHLCWDINNVVLQTFQSSINIPDIPKELKDKEFRYQLDFLLLLAEVWAKLNGFKKLYVVDHRYHLGDINAVTHARAIPSTLEKIYKRIPRRWEYNIEEVDEKILNLVADKNLDTTYSPQQLRSFNEFMVKYL